VLSPPQSQRNLSRVSHASITWSLQSSKLNWARLRVAALLVVRSQVKTNNRTEGGSLKKKDDPGSHSANSGQRSWTFSAWCAVRVNELASRNADAPSMKIQRRNSCTHVCSFDALIPSWKGSKNLLGSGAERWQKNSTRPSALSSWPSRRAETGSKTHLCRANAFRVPSTNSKKDALSPL